MVIGRQRNTAFVPMAAIALALLWSVSTGVAQDVKATARVDSNTIVIGDFLKLHLDVEHPPNVSVVWPQIADSLEGLEIIQRGDHTVNQSGSTVLESQTMTITGYDSGTFVVPPLPFQYTTQGDTVRKIAATLPVLVTVHGVRVDTTKDIRDIKPPMTPSITFAEVLPYLIAVVVIGGLGWLLYYFYKKRKRGESILPEAPARPANEVALEALTALESEHLWQRGKVKDYYSQLTDIVRVYIDRRFGVMAMELTTDEILSAKEIAELDKQPKEQLKEVLVRSDLVKFAKFQPMPEENEKSLPLATAFVEETWRSPAIPESVTVPEEVKA